MLNKPNFSQPFFISQVLQPSDCAVALLWTHSNSSTVYAVALGLDAVLQMGPHEGIVVGDSPFPLPAATSVDAAQDTVDRLGLKSTALAHVQLFSTGTPKSSSAGLLSVSSASSLYICQGLLSHKFST